MVMRKVFKIIVIVLAALLIGGKEMRQTRLLRA